MGRSGRWGRLLRAAGPPALGVLAFFVVRLLVVLGSGDIVRGIGDQEAKHTEIAFALTSGTFGTGGWSLRDFVLTSGNLHHASYSTVAFAFVALSKLFGPTLLAVRLLPLLAWTGALAVLCLLVRRRLGPLPAALLPLGFLVAPLDLIALQLTCIGAHVEVVLPLALALLGWSELLDGEARGKLRVGLAGAALGYAVGFSYLMAPVLLGLLVLAALPPWRRPQRAELGALLGGFVLGLWPLLLLNAFDPGGMFIRPLTEDTSTSFLTVVTGSGRGLDEFLRSFFWALRLDWVDGRAFAPGGRALWIEGGIFMVRSILVAGPLLLLPAALCSAPGARRLGLAFALLPLGLLVTIAATSPFDFVRPPYVMPVVFLGSAWPGLALGFGWCLLRCRGWPDRALGVLTMGVGAVAVVVLLAICAPRLPDGVRLDRAAALAGHRYAAYWHYGMGPVFADEVQRANDLLDVRAAEGHPFGAFGMELGMPNLDVALELGSPGPWTAGEVGWPEWRVALLGWEELWRNLTNARPELVEEEHRVRIAETVGRALALRTDGDGARVVGMVAAAVGEGLWPQPLPLGPFWRGYGFGAARGARLEGVPGGAPPWIALVPSEYAPEAEAGWEQGFARGDVPVMPRRPTLVTVRPGPT